MLTVTRYSTTPGGGGSDGHIAPPGPRAMTRSHHVRVWGFLRRWEKHLDGTATI